MIKINKREDGFTFVEVIIVILILTIIGVVGWYVWYSHNKTNSSASSTTLLSNDSETEQDLNKISTAASNQLSNHNSLPSSLNQLHISGLHNKVSNYSYSSSSQSEVTGTSWEFTLCAIFSENGLQFLASNNDYSLPTVFDYHDKGSQCFEFTFPATYGGNNFTYPILTASEKAQQIKANTPAAKKVVVEQTYDSEASSDIANINQIYLNQAKEIGLDTATNSLVDKCVDMSTESNLQSIYQSNTASKQVYSCEMDTENQYGIDVKQSSATTEETNFTDLSKLAATEGFKESGMNTSTDLSLEGLGCTMTLNQASLSLNYAFYCNLPYFSVVPSGFTLPS